MKQKWLTRLIFAGLIGGFLWIAKNLTETPQLVITERDSARPGGEFEAMTGEVMESISFGPDGRREVTVRARRGKQMVDREWVLSELELEVATRDGNTLTLFADRFREDPSGNRVIESDVGSRISFVEADGFRMQTPGPVLLNVRDVFSSSAETEFQWGRSKGGCLGMKYLSDAFFEMSQQARFNVAQDEHPLNISADKIYLDLKRQIGFVDEGQVHAVSPESDVGFAARDLVFFYDKVAEDAPFEIREFHGIGSPGRVSWGQGSMEAQSFVACFSAQGSWLEQIVTGPDATFSLATQDGHDLRGRSGALTMDCLMGEPEEISSPSAVSIQGELDSGEPFFLDGGQRLLTQFSDGRVTNTVITGEPVFAFRNQHGRAGTIRLLHSEGRILLSQGAVLRDDEEHVEIQGEEILLANWAQDVHEVFAREFVTLNVHPESETPFLGRGDQLNLKMPERVLELKGAPARFQQGDNWVEALEVRVVPEEGGRMSLSAETQVRFSALLDGKTCVANSNRLEMSQQTGIIQLDQVTAAQVPDFGQLAADQLRLQAKLMGANWELKALEASGQVTVEGVLDPEGDAQSFSCQADLLNFDPQTREVRVAGTDRDVIVLFGSGSEHRSRQLTFNLKDGRMHADSGKHGFPKTFLNIKEKRSDTPVPR